MTAPLARREQQHDLTNDCGGLMFGAITAAAQIQYGSSVATVSWLENTEKWCPKETSFYFSVRFCGNSKRLDGTKLKKKSDDKVRFVTQSMVMQEKEPLYLMHMNSGFVVATLNVLVV